LEKPDKGDTMTKRIQKMFVPLAAVTALAVGGAAIASAATHSATSNAPVKQSAAAAEPVGGPDTDNIQSGDQTTPDTAVVKATKAASTTEAPGTEQSPASEKAGTAEAPGTEQSPASEAGSAEAPGSETAANSDGPGGHADEPGNPNADHQFQGQE
jgi:hypothetical protein